MIVLHVTAQVKPEHVKEFLEVVRYDAEHSETDEPGCLRFDLIQDRDDPNRFYFYEVYRDEARWRRTGKRPTSNSISKRSSPGSPRRRSAASAKT